MDFPRTLFSRTPFVSRAFLSFPPRKRGPRGSDDVSITVRGPARLSAGSLVPGVHGQRTFVLPCLRWLHVRLDSASPRAAPGSRPLPKKGRTVLRACEPLNLSALGMQCEDRKSTRLNSR